MSIRYLVSYQREACLAVLGGSTVDMMTFSIWIVIEHFVLLAPSYIIWGRCGVSFASFQVNAKSTTVKRLLGLDFNLGKIILLLFCVIVRTLFDKFYHNWVSDVNP